MNIILLNIIVFFALVSIHEIVHIAVGSCFGCEYGKAVILDAGFNGPYAEMVCSTASQFVVYASSFLVTACFGLMFLSLNSPGKNLSFIILGLSLIFSSVDIGLITMRSLIYPIAGSGFLLVTLGEYYIASACISKNLFLDIFELQD